MFANSYACQVSLIALIGVLAPVQAVAQGNANRAGTSIALAPVAGPNTAGRAMGTGQATVSQRTETLELEVGEQRVLSSENVQSYSEGGKGIVDVRLTKDASQFVVVGLRQGSSSLLFLMNDGTERHYKITVTDPNAPMQRRSGNGAVEARDNIRLDFYFVQIDKKNGYQIGVGWPGTVAPTMNASMDLKTGTLDSATAVISSQALPRLDMAQSSGWAKVMRQAAVVTANGEKAAFAGGGEINVAITSALTTGIQKIPYGSRIEVEPRYDSDTGRIELRLHADVAELDSSGGTLPGRTTASLDTIVNIEIGQSLILGGLTATSERRSKSGIPLLSQIPILGAFFGSHTYADAETENVVIIVPSVVDAISMQDRERLRNALHRYREYSGDMSAGERFVPEANTSKPKTRTKAK